jgi:hypothetical protein
MRTPSELGVAQSVYGLRGIRRLGGTAAHRSLEVPLGKYRSKNVRNVKGSDSMKSETGNPGPPDPG